MEEDVRDWYYTTGADQAGPVTFGELKAKAAASELHPRNDMVWKQTMDQWVPAGQIEDLFERRPSDSAADAPAVSMSALAGNKPTEMVEVDLWPGASRRWYLLLVMLFPVFWMAISMAFATFVGPKLSPGFQKLFLLLGIIVPVWVVVDTTLSRLSNLGMNKLWFFVNFIPVINLWVGYRTFACPAGYAKIKKLDPIGWVLAVIYWLFLVSCVAVAILVPALIATALQDSDFMEQFETLREQVESGAMDHEESSEENGSPDDPTQAEP